MQTYKVMLYSDYIRNYVKKVETYKAENIDNLRRNLAKRYVKRDDSAILTILTDSFNSIGDFFIGYEKSNGPYLYWRKPFAGDDWQIVDPATGKLKGRY